MGKNDGPLRRRVEVVNRRGLHARAAAKFVKAAEQFEAQIEVAKDDLRVSGISIMGLMMLAAATGSTRPERCVGHDREPADVLRIGWLDGSGAWSNATTMVRLKGSGCYAYEITAPGVHENIAFRAAIWRVY